MERACIALIMINLSYSQVSETFTEATSSRVVQLGDTVTLHCDVKHDKETIWHGQRHGKVPFIIIAAKDKHGKPGETETKYFRGYDPRFKTFPFSANNSVDLKIANLTISDLGLYYCSTKPDVPMLTGLGTMLVLAENCNFPATTVSNGSAIPTISPEVEPGVRVHCWILMAILSPVCIVVGALLYRAYLHWKHCRTGSECCEAQNTSMDGNTDGKEEEVEPEVIYTALKIPSGKSTQTRRTLDTE
ncbi:uncharacterized protein LOC118210858 [Anguilla anguilla]|uniref:uncharacterized protein LOC118210858 n=1 Tax=Anguilla anguilla TaxID=7936 RepID=UPI0015A9B7BE|nr:uncharacterized protein LOC118210858 [Anguilla anguilla]